MQCYTYATHEEFGLWRLVHNPYVAINVLGMGKPWVSFMDKVQAYYEVCRDAADDDILVFVDGFDAEIVLPEKDILERFYEKKTRVLFGIDYHAPETIDSMVCAFGRHYNKMVFHDDIGLDFTINSGVCIGFAAQLRTVWYEMLRYSEENACRDDQRALNILFSRGAFPFMAVDTEGSVILNVMNCCRHRLIPGQHGIVQTPGTFTKRRFQRAVDEYYEYILSNDFFVMHQDTIKGVARSVIDMAFTRYDQIVVDPAVGQEPIVKVSIIRYSLGIDDAHHTGLLINERYVFDKSLFSTGLSSIKDIHHPFHTTDVPLPHDYPTSTVFEFVDRVRQYVGPTTYYSYCVTRNNCQHFVRSALRANGLSTTTIDVEDIVEKVKQWTSHVVKNSIMPVLHYATRCPA